MSDEKEIAAFRASLSSPEARETFDGIVGDLRAELEITVGALQSVRFWLHDLLFRKLPMRIPPRQILQIVERALEDA